MVSDQTQTVEQPSKPLLDFSTVAPTRPTVKIDGELYELRLLEHDFSAEQHADFQRDLTEFDALWVQEKRTRNEGKRMSMLLDRLARMVLDAPAGVLDKLSEEQRRAVVVTFQYAPALEAALAQQNKTQSKARRKPSTTGS